MEPDQPPATLALQASMLFVLVGTSAVGGLVIGFIILLIMLACSALISGSEVAYFSISPDQQKSLSQENSKSANRILNLRAKPRILLATILICNNFINIGIVLLSNFLVNGIFAEQAFSNWGQSLANSIGLWSNQSWAIGLEFLITTVFATFVLVLFGEITPKIYANFNNLGFAKLMSGPLLVLRRLFMPLSQLLVKGAWSIEKRLSRNSLNSTERKDIDKAIELTVTQDQHSDQEVDILKRIITFGDVAVKQIMRSHVDIVSLQVDQPFEEVMEVVRNSGYSRIPVYEEDLDKIIGILYIKDLLIHLNKKNFKWNKLVREQVKFVPEAKKIDELLKEFQQERTHLAIVVDEFGATQGLITLEDIMEEVIGDIQDEFDNIREVEYDQIDDFTYVFEGKTLLNDLCRILQIDTQTFDDIKGDADSIAGLMLQLLGRMPKRQAELKVFDYRLKVLSVNERRIEKIQITLPRKR